ncbi:MAG: GTP cyclohydrolase MptA [Candidatus Thermoplasmatota archaeon]|nr:GTP cyclohydrolase MptA [Candidatus Thermoplasmatota archaeon]
MSPNTDVQGMTLDKGFRISRVGITGVQKPIRVSRKGREIDLTTTIDVFVDLPGSLRGSHMSRNAELINEVVDSSVKQPVPSLESLASKMSQMLLEKHEYAEDAEVWLQATYFLERSTPEGRLTLEPYKIMAQGKAKRNGECTKMVGVEVQGISACPCAMEGMRAILKEKHPHNAKAIDEMPVPSHNQRNVTTLMLGIPCGMEARVEADELIGMVEKGMSSPSYEILKRRDEARLVYEAHKNPRFVEDIVRTVLSSVVEKYQDFPDDTLVLVKSEAQESIHKHNAMAERAASLGELRA